MTTLLLHIIAQNSRKICTIFDLFLLLVVSLYSLSRQSLIMTDIWPMTDFWPTSPCALIIAVLTVRFHESCFHQRPHTAKCTRFLSQIWTRLMLDDAFWLKSRLRSWLNSDFVWAKSGPIIPKGEVTVSDEFAWLLMVWRDDVDGMVVFMQIIYHPIVCFCSNAAVCEISTITWHRRQLLFSSTI